MKSRRLVALIGAFAVAFGALWPLVSAARPRPPAAIPSFICTQSGFQVPHAAPSSPGDAHDKFHCPLCLVTVEATLPLVPPSLTWAMSSEAPLDAPGVSTLHSLFRARPPPSRAPPVRS
jgi:hypothetical protein